MGPVKSLKPPKTPPVFTHRTRPSTMTDIEYWDGELTSKIVELEQSIGSLKSLFGGDKEAVRARGSRGREGGEGGRVELGVW